MNSNGSGSGDGPEDDEDSDDDDDCEDDEDCDSPPPSRGSSSSDPVSSGGSPSHVDQEITSNHHQYSSPSPAARDDVEGRANSKFTTKSPILTLNYTSSSSATASSHPLTLHLFYCHHVFVAVSSLLASYLLLSPLLLTSL